MAPLIKFDKDSRKILLPFIALFSIIIFLVIYFESDLSLDNARCSQQEYFKSMEYSGVVDDKFNDPNNHRFPTFTLRQRDNQHFLAFTYPRDNSGLYEFLSKGDSVYKEFGSLAVFVIRNDKEVSFNVDFQCND